MQAKNKSLRPLIWLAAALISAAALPARADDPATLQRFLDCRSITDNPNRLACFDAAAGAVTAAEKPQPAKTPEEAKRSVEESFGHEALTAEQRHDEKQADSYRARVLVFSADAYGNLILVLENGQVWRQTDGEQTPLLTGEQWVTIRHAAVGSYLITIEGARRTHRFKRIK
jgi:hypothetical protein